MIKNQLRTISDRIAAARINFDGFETSCVAGCSWIEGQICLGSDDGRIKFSSLDGRPSQYNYDPPVVDSGEAINGLAFSGRFMVVTTRSEVAFWDVPGPGDNRSMGRAVREGGAHGVISTLSGRFIAPMGLGGFQAIDARPGDSQPMQVHAASLPLDYYRAAYLGEADDGGDVLGFAVRGDGLATAVMSRSGELSVIDIVTHPGVDVVDVCSLRSEAMPRAAIWVGRDRSLHLSKDVLTDHRPRRFRLDSLRGVAYRVLASREHVFLLTSDRLYILADLAANFAEGRWTVGSPLRVGSYELEAIDAELIHDRLVIVMPDLVIVANVADLAGSVGSSRVDQVISSDWEAFAVAPHSSPALILSV